MKNTYLRMGNDKVGASFQWENHLGQVDYYLHLHDLTEGGENALYLLSSREKALSIAHDLTELLHVFHETNYATVRLLMQKKTL